MEIYYGKFLGATKAILTGESYYMYFNSEEALFAYYKYMRERGKNDILEYVGKAYFNSRGRLVEDEEHAKRLYDPDDEGHDVDDDMNEED